MRAARVSCPPVFSSNRRLIFAHRGGAKLAPENTIAAFDRGMACGADGLELDTQLSKDGVAVVIHDKTLDRTTDRGGRVHDLTAAELASVDAGYRFEKDGAFPFRGQGIGIPTLAAVMQRYPAARVIIEMKGGEHELAHEVARIVRDAGAVDRVCAGSFYRTSVEELRRHAPEIVTSASEPESRWTLHRSWIRFPWVSARPYAAFQVPERVGRMRVASPGFFRQAHREGQTVQVWVVDTPADAMRLFAWGADGLISDRPDLLVPARDEWERQHGR